MTLKQLMEWAAKLPPEMQDAEICSVVGCMPLTAKRVVAYKSPEGDLGLVVNSAGTHLDNTWWAESDVVSVMNNGGEVWP